MIPPYLIHISILILIYIVLSTSLNLALGYGGLLNLGHIAFFAIGAYTSALLVKSGYTFATGFFAAAFLAAIIGIALYYITRNLKGDYLALSTLAFSFVTVTLILNLQWLTRGPLGIAGITKPKIFGTVFTLPQTFLFYLLLTIATCFLIWKITTSKYGRLLQAARDDDIGLRVLGKNTYRIKAIAMGASAFFAGIAGSMFAHYISFIEPNSFQITEIILVLTIVIVGGLATVKGSVVAAIIIVGIPELLRFVSLPAGILGPARQILYALILLTILMWRPRGIFGRIDLV